MCAPGLGDVRVTTIDRAIDRVGKTSTPARRNVRSRRDTISSLSISPRPRAARRGGHQPYGDIAGPRSCARLAHDLRPSHGTRTDESEVELMKITLKQLPAILTMACAVVA